MVENDCEDQGFSRISDGCFGPTCRIGGRRIALGRRQTIGGSWGWQCPNCLGWYGDASAPRDRPILFSGPMVRALLAGTKTQTRRVVKWRGLAPGLNLGFSGLHAQNYADGAALYSRRGDGCWEERTSTTPCPHGQPGDRLWVRESLKAVRNGAGYIVDYAYAADGSKVRRCPDLAPEFGDSMAFAHLARPGGVPGIHMPRWARRITLELTDVRVQRLQEISEADAVAEGIETNEAWPGSFYRNYLMHTDQDVRCLPPVQSYRTLWESINGPGSWDANPWLWALTFRRIAP